MKAKYIGKDGSMGFRTGRRYRIHIVQDNNKGWFWVKELYGLYCPYGSMTALEKNWELPEVKFKPLRRYVVS